jgi:HTH-type transcriptional regulator/antitoxin HigA
MLSCQPDTPAGEQLELLVTLVEAYEQKHSPLDLPDPIEAIKFEMERQGLGSKISIR